MKKLIILIMGLALIIAIAADVYSSAGNEGVLKDIAISRESVEQYEMIEISVSVSESYDNPYDGREITLSARISDPEGKIMVVPAFYTGRDSLWKARFTPVKSGAYTYRLFLKYGKKDYASAPGHFKVTGGTGNGFLRKGTANPFYLVFDSGKAFFGLGHNIGWTTNNSPAEYEIYMARLRDSGCNLIRIWTNNAHTFRIEEKQLGRYNIGDSEKLDAVIALAEKYGIYVILVLDSYGSLMEEKGPWNEERWRYNPYNKINGGPCEDPADFFTNADAKRYYKDRLRYIVGRWGYSPNILAFELWNEYDAPPKWTSEMALYMKSINPHGQLITTSLGYPWDNNFDQTSIWSLPEIDIIERHLYGDRVDDIIENLMSVNHELTKRYGKPIIVGEFGMDGTKSDARIDKAGNAVALHNSLWAAALTRSFASALNWWWEEYVLEKNLYPHYTALKNFLEDVKWDSARVEPLEIGTITVLPECQTVSLGNVDIPTAENWGDTSYSDFTINNNSDVMGGTVNGYLHGITKAKIRLEPVFRVNYPSDGKFIIQVGTVSQEARLIVSVDGKEVFAADFTTGPGKGPWKESSYLKEYDIYQCLYDTQVEVPVSKGRHVIKLSNTGKDWLGIKRITLANYACGNFANARVIGLRAGDDILIWAANKEYNWEDDAKGVQPPAIKGASFSISDITTGTYAVEWWDTFNGKIMAHEIIKSENNALCVTLPEFTKDIACKIRRIA